MRRLIIATAAALTLAGCTVVGMSNTPEPRFEVVETLDERTEIRRYAPRAAAEVVLADADRSDGSNRAFRHLFRYISGDNRADAEIAMTAPVETREGVSEKIAMTVPVEMDARADGFAMRFFLPDAYTAETAPRPTDPKVDIVAVPEQTMAALTFSGFRGEDKVSRMKAALLDTLADSAWTPTGEPVAYFYDPPWSIPFLRRNEVAVPVAPRP